MLGSEDDAMRKHRCPWACWQDGQVGQAATHILSLLIYRLDPWYMKIAAKPLR